MRIDSCGVIYAGKIAINGVGNEKMERKQIGRDCAGGVVGVFLMSKSSVKKKKEIKDIVGMMLNVGGEEVTLETRKESQLATARQRLWGRQWVALSVNPWTEHSTFGKQEGRDAGGDDRFGTSFLLSSALLHNLLVLVVG